MQKKQTKKKLSNRVPETTTTQAVPSLSCARTCMAVRAWPYVQKKKKKNFQTTTQAEEEKKKRKHCDVIRDVIAPCPVIGLVNKCP